MRQVHTTAIVDPRAEIHDTASVGPYAIVEAGVRVGPETRLHAHAVVLRGTTLGARNVVHSFAVVGGLPQMRDACGGGPARGRLEIGDENVIREHATLNVSSGESPTRLGSGNLVMAGAHVAHDVVIGSRCVLANGVALAGHVVVGDFVNFGGGAAVAQFVHVGESAFVAGGAMCERDVPPFVIVQGDRARVRALNVVGLERRGVPASSIAALRGAVARLYGRRGGSFAEALAALDRTDPWVARLADAVSA